MATVQEAMYAKQQIQHAEWEQHEENEGMEVRRVYIGSFMHLDPCGRYHHAMLSPNGLTDRCVRYWESLERQLEKRGLSLESGEGDPTDTYACEYRTKEESKVDTKTIIHVTPDGRYAYWVQKTQDPPPAAGPVGVSWQVSHIRGLIDALNQEIHQAADDTTTLEVVIRFGDNLETGRGKDVHA